MAIKPGERKLQILQTVAQMLLCFAQKNRGMTRVLTGCALVNEDERLQQRINRLLDRIEATLKQSLRMAATQRESAETAEAGAQANLLMCYVIGRWHQFDRSGFTRDPMAQWQAQAAILLDRQ